MSNWRQMDAFIADTHGEGHVLRNRPLFDWFFVRDEGKQDANLIVAYEDDKLISLLGYIPTRFIWGGEVIAGAWMAHWMTMKGHRFGIGALLMKRITELFPVVAGQGASLMNQAIVTKMNFTFLERIPKVVFIFRQQKIQQIFDSRMPVGELGTLDRRAFPTETRTISKDNFDPDWSNYPSMRFGTLRDGDYLTYRYLDYPFFKYHVFIQGEPTSPAILVARIVETKEGLRVARILEFFFPETESGRAQGLSLARACLHFFKQTDCDYADYYCTAQTQLDLLSQAGWVDESAGALPSLLDPIDISRKSQNLELWVSRDLKVKYPGCESSFFVTRADGDQDRPNESYRDPQQ